MAGIEKVVAQSYIKELVEKQAKTHKEVSELLRQRYPAVEGLSERSARRYVPGGYSIYPWVGRCGTAPHTQPRSQGLFPGLEASRPQAREKTLGTRLPHTLTLFKTNIADFPTLFKTEFRFFNTLFKTFHLNIN